MDNGWRWGGYIFSRDDKDGNDEDWDDQDWNGVTWDCCEIYINEHPQGMDTLGKWYYVDLQNRLN